jgi:hypothetical protein
MNEARYCPRTKGIGIEMHWFKGTIETIARACRVHSWRLEV